METMTINIDGAVAKRFRRKAEERYGKRKGYLGKAVSEAMTQWTKGGDGHVDEALRIMDKGIKLGLKYAKRSELYEGTD